MCQSRNLARPLFRLFFLDHGKLSGEKRGEGVLLVVRSVAPPSAFGNKRRLRTASGASRSTVRGSQGRSWDRMQLAIRGSQLEVRGIACNWQFVGSLWKHDVDLHRSIGGLCAAPRRGSWVGTDCTDQVGPDRLEVLAFLN